MKCALLIIVACALSTQLAAQKLTKDTLPGSSSLYDTYLKKAERKFRAARTLRFIAIGSAVTSGIFFLVAVNKSTNNSSVMFAGLEEGIVGFGFGAVAIGSGLTSIFLNASAKKYKKAAMSLTPVVKLQPVAIPGPAIHHQLTGSVVWSF